MDKDKWKKEYFELLYSTEELPNYLAKLTILKLKILPKKLYRYRPINEFVEDTLRNDIAFLSLANNFNDPYDSGLTVDYTETFLEKIKDGVLTEYCRKFHHIVPDHTFEELYSEFKNLTKDIPLKYIGQLLGNTLNQSDEVIQDIVSKIESYVEQTKDIYENYIKELTETYQSGVYAACFSETNDNILMWSHYAQYHGGICIEYDFSNTDFRSRTLLTLSPVKYTNELFDMNTYAKRTAGERIQLAALSKFDCWAYENEWRLISFLQEEQHFKLNVPTAVILGTKISEENKALVTTICAERDIPVKQAVLDRTQYKLHIK